MPRRSLLVKLCLAALMAAIGFASCASGSVLSDLAAAKSYRAARISSVDPTGANNDGSQVNRIQAGETRTIAEINGPGQIAHFWITTFANRNVDLLRDVILRIYWDGERTPSVEAPLGEFFGLGHGRYYTYESLPMVIGNNTGLNCFFPMPFKKSAKITVQNLASGEISDFYYYVDYQIFDKPKDDLLYFHAQYRQEKPVLTHDDYTILRANGRGHYVGCFLYVRTNEPNWWGEGDDAIYVDGSKKPVLEGTGTEDYFCQSWGFAKNTSTMRFGAPLGDDDIDKKDAEWAVYRFHLEDAIPFTKSIAVTMEHGYAETNDRSDDFSSVAYWYQTEPHAEFPRLAAPADRRSTADRLKKALNEKRFEDYRRLCQDIQNRTPSSWMRRQAMYDIAESYALEGNSGAAIKAFTTLLDSRPGNPWTDKARKRIQELGGDVSASSRK